jgi:hypothetical protein
MATVNSKANASSGQDESIRRNREEYRKKEAELVKKHAREMRSSNEKHASEIEKVQNQHTTHLNDVRERSQDSLTSRDMKYQKEMEDLRKLHNNQLKRANEDSLAKTEQVNKAAKHEMKQANLGKEDRTLELSSKYNAQMSEEKQRFEDQLNKVKRDADRDIEERSRRISGNYENNLDAVVDERNETVAALKRERRQERLAANDRLRNQEIRHAQDKGRVNEFHMDSIAHERQVHNDLQEHSRKAQSESLDTVRDKLNQARESDREESAGRFLELRDDVNERVEGQVNRLKRQVAKQQDEGIRTNRDNQMRANREVNNTRMAYHDKFEALEKSRKEILTQQNEVNTQDILKLRKENDDLLTQNARFYLDQMQMDSFRNKNAISEIKQEKKLHEDVQRQQSDTRVKMVKTEADNREQKLREKFDAGIQIMKTGQEDEQKEVVLRLNQEKMTAVQAMKEQIQKQEVENESKLSSIIAKYEKRLAEINDGIVKDKRIKENRERTLVRDMQRQFESEKETLKIKYEEQAKNSELRHKDEIRDVNRRNQERLDEALSIVRKGQG